MSRIQAGRSLRRTGVGAEKSKIQALVEEKLAAKQNYEAMQLYRGQAARKVARGLVDDMARILEEGVVILMDKGYVDSATELACQMVDSFSEHHAPVTSERIAVVMKIDTVYADTVKRLKLEEVEAAKTEKRGVSGGDEGGDGGDGAAEVHKLEAEKKEGEEESGLQWEKALHYEVKFLKKAATWAQQEGVRVHGDPEINAALGKCLWEQGKVELALKCLTAGEQPLALAELVKDGKVDPGSREILVTRGILAFVSMQNMRDGHVLLNAYVENLSGKPGMLLMFCSMLLQMCEYDAAPEFMNLRKDFAGPISTDGKLNVYLNTIGAKYFNIAPPKSMLEQMMSMFAM